MAMVIMSVDTNTRQSTLTVDGELVPAVACHIMKGLDYDGKPYLDLRYVTEADKQNGIMERREFVLMQPKDDEDDDNHGYSNKLQSRKLNDNEAAGSKYYDLKVTSDIHNYMAEKKNS